MYNSVDLRREAPSSMQETDRIKNTFSETKNFKTETSEDLKK